MKIYSAEKIREADAYTINHEPIESIELMERAALNLFKWISKHYARKHPVYVFCGTGNNGGDGLALSRMLDQKGYLVKVIILRFSDNSSIDFKINEFQLKHIGVEMKNIKSIKAMPKIEPGALVIDAIFGSGLSRSVTGLAAEVIDKLNKLPVERLAIDIASGLFSEDNAKNSGTVFRPHITLTLAFPKLAFMFAVNADFVGEWHLIPIGISEEFILREPAEYFLTDRKLARIMHKPAGMFDHKGTYGHALLIGGSYGKIGAVVLASKAALRSGAGLVTAFIPQCGYNIMQTVNPEVMVRTGEGKYILADSLDTNVYHAVGIGPGLGTDPDTGNAVFELLQKTTLPMVIDADALNMLAANPEWMKEIPNGSILTPHPGEWKRLHGKKLSGLRQIDALKKFAAKHKVIVVLKGGVTAIASPDGEVFFNNTGNPGMATAGSGDALTGIITGLLAQGYRPKEAAILGVYVHGRAGNRARKKYGREGLLASDIINKLGKTFQKI